MTLPSDQDLDLLLQVAVAYPGLKRRYYYVAVAGRLALRFALAFFA